MKQFTALTARNIKLFYKDKGMFFTSLITPVILLVLYATFLANVYRDNLVSQLPNGATLPDKLINGFVGGELFSSLLAVCCVTVAFCSNLLMVQDRVTGARDDLTISPVKSSVLSLSYYAGTLISTLSICYMATLACFVYMAKVGWYLSAGDVFQIIADVFILVMFGTALSSVINSFLSTQGQMSAVGTVISAGYGFICGAYMPISSFGTGLQRALSFLPGTYGTSLIRNHALNGVFKEIADMGFPAESISAIRDGVDCNVYFFDKAVSQSAMYVIMAASVLALILIYIFIGKIRAAKAR